MGKPRSIIATHIQTKVQTVFPSASEASKKLFNGSSRCNITTCCTGKRKYVEGYTFRYEDDNVIHDDTFKQFRDTYAWFSPNFNFGYNSINKINFSQTNDGRLKYKDQNENKFITVYFAEARWIAINGKEIPEGYKIFDDELVECICKECGNQFDITYRTQKYCNNKCKDKHGSQIAKEKDQIDILAYCRSKATVWRVSGDYLAELGKDRTCVYCGKTDLNLRNADGRDPNKLSFDCIVRKEGESVRDAHREGNLNACCWLCNRMRGVASFELWTKLLKFLKGEKDLDLSDEPFIGIGTNISRKFGNIKARPWDTIYTHEREAGRNILPKEAKPIFGELMTKQNKIDNIYNLFPLVSFNIAHHPLNVSADLIKSGDLNSGYQLIPLFLNYAKNNLSNDELKNEFKIRGFLENSKTIILPTDYYDKSFFDKTYHLKLGHGEKTGLGNGRKGFTNSKESIERMKKTKQAQKLAGTLKCATKSIQMLTNEENPKLIRTFDSITLAGEYIKSKYIGNISSCASGKLNTAYGYKWKYV
jgi:hypothetical protein